MLVDFCLSIGAFSYAVSGYYFGAQIGRYTSIGESVQVGRGSHPVSWASTSPVLYQDYRSVVDLDLPEANGFYPTAGHLAPRKTIIGNDVYIGHGAFISQGVTIGDGAVVGAQAVVTRDVPPYAVVAGSPATVRRMRFDDSTIERMAALRWWEYAFWDLQGLPLADVPAFLDGIENLRVQGRQIYQPKVLRLEELISI